MAGVARYGVFGGVCLEDNDDPVVAGGRGNGEHSNPCSTLRDTGAGEFENTSWNIAIGNSRDATFSYMTGFGLVGSCHLVCPVRFAPVQQRRWVYDELKELGGTVDFPMHASRTLHPANGHALRWLSERPPQQEQDIYLCTINDVRRYTHFKTQTLEGIGRWR